MKTNQTIFFWSLFILTILQACSTYDEFTLQNLDPISAVKQQFKEDSLKFHQTRFKEQKSFRQSLERHVNWSKAIITHDTTHVPIILQLPKGMTSDGTNYLHLESWLRITNWET